MSFCFCFPSLILCLSIISVVSADLLCRRAAVVARATISPRDRSTRCPKCVSSVYKSIRSFKAILVGLIDVCNVCALNGIRLCSHASYEAAVYWLCDEVGFSLQHRAHRRWYREFVKRNCLHTCNSRLNVRISGAHMYIIYMYIWRWAAVVAAGQQRLNVGGTYCSSTVGTD